MQTEELGKFIKLKRTERGLTQRELSKLLYVSTSTICKWEKGRHYPDREMLFKISSVLEIPYNLISDTQNSSSDNIPTLTLIPRSLINIPRKKYLFILGIFALFLLVSVGGFVLYKNINPSYKFITSDSITTEYGPTFVLSFYRKTEISDIEFVTYSERIQEKWLNGDYKDNGEDVLKICIYYSLKQANLGENPDRFYFYFNEMEH